MYARIDFWQDYLFEIIVMKKKPLKFFFCVESRRRRIIGAGRGIWLLLAANLFS